LILFFEKWSERGLVFLEGHQIREDLGGVP